jgi:hypothetical protein
MLLLCAYASSPGDRGAPSGRWPSGSGLQLDDRRLTLLMFLHPRCPCSRASLAEMGAILDRCSDRVSARAVIFQPRRDREGWLPADLKASLAEIPSLGLCLDPGGDEGRRFGVETSGHVLLYDPRGDMIFSGGITSARGERGDNLGRAALLGRIMSTRGDKPASPVFGCPLMTPRPSPNQGRR